MRLVAAALLIFALRAQQPDAKPPNPPEPKRAKRTTSAHRNEPANIFPIVVPVCTGLPGNPMMIFTPTGIHLVSEKEGLEMLGLPPAAPSPNARTPEPKNLR